MVIALLTIPPSMAKQHTTNLKSMMLLSVALGIILTTGGLWASYMLDLASGATVIILLVIAFVISTMIKKIKE